MLDQNTIDRIYDAANIVDVVSDYVTLRRSGASYKGLCPFHDDKTPSFYVNPAKQICKCFSCGKGGNVVHFIMEEEQLGYYDALRFLAKRYGIEVKEREYSDEERKAQNDRESMFAVNEWASNYFHDLMLNDPDGRAIGLAYFRNRGVRDDIIEKFRLGFCLDRPDAMAKAALQKGYREEYIVRTGLAYKRDNGTFGDKFRGRVMFPWFNVSGQISAFGGRVLAAATKGVAQKYMNSPNSDIFVKENELYGIFQAKKQIAKENLVYMVEGYTDVIAMHQCGIENVVANSGTALSEAQIRILHRFTTNITLIYDGDAAGIHAAQRGINMLLADGMNVKVLLLPDGDDPDSFSKKHTADEFRQYVAAHQTDFIVFKTNLSLQGVQNDPLRRSQLATEILKSICVIPDEITRAAYVHECSELMKMNEAMLLRQCNNLRREYIEQKKLERERQKQREQRLAERQQQQQSAAPISPTTTAGGTAAPTSGTADAGTTAPPPADGESRPFEPLPDEAYDNEEPPTQQSATTATPTNPIYVPTQSKLVQIEKLIMTQVVRHGWETFATYDAEGNPCEVTVAEFVREELDVDELTFQHPLYAQMMQLAAEHIGEEGFDGERFFRDYPSLDVSREAADMLTNRYQLSEIMPLTEQEQSLSRRIPHLMLDYKFELLSEEMARLKKQLKTPEVLAETDKQLEIMQQIAELRNGKRLLAERLGDRVM